MTREQELTQWSTNKQLLEKAAKAATKTHKERVAEFNEKLENLSEHYDIPKVSRNLPLRRNPIIIDFAECCCCCLGWTGVKLSLFLTVHPAPILLSILQHLTTPLKSTERFDHC